MREVVSALRDELARRGEVAHAKVLFEPEAPSDAGVAIANFVGADSEVFSTTRARGGSTRGRLLVNARVHLDPVELRRSAERALDRVLPRFRASHRTLDGSHFRPGRPIPLHRFGASATP